MSVNNLTPKVRSKAKKVLNLAVKSKRSMKLNELNFVRTSTFIRKEAKRINKPRIDKRKLKKLIKTDFGAIASQNLGGGGGGGLLGLLGDLLGFGGGGRGGRRGGRGGRGGPPSRRAQQRYRRRFGNRAGNRRFGRLPQFGRGARGLRGGFGPRGGLLGAAFAGLEYGGRVSEGQTQTQAITGTAASTAGGIAGAYAGAKGGALLGAGIGAFFGGVGAVPGAAIGGFVGGLAGGFGGSMLAGGAADKLTGVVGKDKDAEKSEKELEEKSKINPLELTLDKFDSVVERFSKVILNLNLAGEEEKSDEELAIEKYGDDIVDAFKKTQETARKKEEQKQKALEEKQKAISDIKEGPFGDIVADTMFPGEKENVTAKTLNALGVPQEYQAITEMMIESLVSGIAMSRGRGVPARPVRPLTKPTSIKIGDRVGPDIFPVRPPAPASSVRQTTPATGPLSKPKPRVLSEAMNSAGNTRAKLGEFNNVRRAESDAIRDMLGGSFGKGYKRTPQQVESIQEMISRALKANIKPEFNPSSLTEPITNFMPKGGTQLKLDIPKISTDKNPFKPTKTIEKKFGDQSSVSGINQSSSGINQSSSDINYYTSYNAPNNTTIIMQQSGGQMPPQSPPPQMMASAPPPMMSSGPSSYDVALKMHGIFQLNNLQTT